MSENYEVNSDGVYRRYGRPRNTQGMPGEQQHLGPGGRNLEFDLVFDDLPDFTADLDGDGTDDGWSGNDMFIPSGSFIKSAYIVVEDAFAGGTSYNVGLYEVDGTVIDADGIDAGVAVADLAADSAVVCDGALVGGTATTGSADAYLRVVPTGTFTAGKARLFVEYLPVTV